MSLSSRKTVKVSLLNVWMSYTAVGAVTLTPQRFCASAEYAQVLRMLGNGRLEAMCIDSTKRLCHIRGKMRKKVWVNTVGLLTVRASRCDGCSVFPQDMHGSWSMEVCTGMAADD